MKKLLLLAVLVSCISYSCIPDDSDSGADPEGPIIANIRFDVFTSRNSEAIITTTIDDATQTDTVDNLPFSFTYTDIELESGTYLKLTYLENGSYVVTPEGSSWTDYTAILSIYADDILVETQTFSITEGSGVQQIDFTFN